MSGFKSSKILLGAQVRFHTKLLTDLIITWKGDQKDHFMIQQQLGSQIQQFDSIPQSQNFTTHKIWMKSYGLNYQNKLMLSHMIYKMQPIIELIKS